MTQLEDALAKSPSLSHHCVRQQHHRQEGCHACVLYLSECLSEGRGEFISSNFISKKCGKYSFKFASLCSQKTFWKEGGMNAECIPMEFSNIPHWEST
jgi:hypothetical protein